MAAGLQAWWFARKTLRPSGTHCGPARRKPLQSRASPQQKASSVCSLTRSIKQPQLPARPRHSSLRAPFRRQPISSPAPSSLLPSLSRGSSRRLTGYAARTGFLSGEAIWRLHARCSTDCHGLRLPNVSFACRPRQQASLLSGPAVENVACGRRNFGT
jgi:hypothetical protein